MDVLYDQIGARSTFDQGETAEFGAGPDRLHLFDADTGETLYHSDRALDAEERPPVQ